jgi:hypothetical protein
MEYQGYPSITLRTLRMFRMFRMFWILWDIELEQGEVVQLYKIRNIVVVFLWCFSVMSYKVCYQ